MHATVFNEDTLDAALEALRDKIILMSGSRQETLEVRVAFP
jgi:hypothetical protein